MNTIWQLSIFSKSLYIMHDHVPTWPQRNYCILYKLERLRSEDTPRRLMITHTIESYWIPSKKKTKSKLQIKKIHQNFKFLNFETGITRDTPSEVAW